ncbi:MAG: hypothetical protein EBS29_03395 [Chloroflexia bacterium]|nr:hypothetical protein [Chloroflexia bacterium]
MPPITEHVVLRDNDVPNIADLDVYLNHEGYEALRIAVTEKTPADVINVVKEAGLRGRGGAGFPTGVKWGFLPKDVYPRYLCCNADESEPGTFNNHQIIDDVGAGGDGNRLPINYYVYVWHRSFTPGCPIEYGSALVRQSQWNGVPCR